MLQCHLEVLCKALERWLLSGPFRGQSGADNLITVTILLSHTLSLSSCGTRLWELPVCGSQRPTWASFLRCCTIFWLSFKDRICHWPGHHHPSFAALPCLGLVFLFLFFFNMGCGNWTQVLLARQALYWVFSLCSNLHLRELSYQPKATQLVGESNRHEQLPNFIMLFGRSWSLALLLGYGYGSRQAGDVGIRLSVWGLVFPWRLQEPSPSCCCNPCLSPEKPESFC